jgi:hypothetical protein
MESRVLHASHSLRLFVHSFPPFYFFTVAHGSVSTSYFFFCLFYTHARAQVEHSMNERTLLFTMNSDFIVKFYDYMQGKHFTVFACIFFALCAFQDPSQN